LQIEDKIYYLRIVFAAIAGSILGIIVKPNSDQSNTIGLTILIGIIFYAISQIIAIRIAKNVPKDKKKKVITIAIFGFMFMLLVFMILIYTIMNQSII